MREANQLKSISLPRLDAVGIVIVSPPLLILAIDAIHKLVIEQGIKIHKPVQSPPRLVPVLLERYDEDIKEYKSKKESLNKKINLLEEEIKDNKKRKEELDYESKE